MVISLNETFCSVRTWGGVEVSSEDFAIAAVKEKENVIRKGEGDADERER